MTGASIGIEGLGGRQICIHGQADSLAHADTRASYIQTELLLSLPELTLSVQAYARDAGACEVVAKGIWLDVEAELPSDLSNLKQVHAGARAYIGEAEWKGESAKGIHLAGQTSKGEWKLSSAARIESLPVALDIGPLAGGGMSVDYELETRLGIWLRLAGVSEEQVGKRLAIAKPLYALGRLNLSDEGDMSTDFLLESWDLNSRGTPIDYIYAKGRADQNELYCSELLLSGGPSTQRGNFRQNLHNAEWHLRLKGDIVPPVLAGLLGHWWNDIWTDFAFQGPPVRADLDLNGSWKRLGHVNIWGSVEMDDVLYQKVRLDKGRLDIYVGEQFVDLCNVEARGADGEIGGRLYWILKPDEPLSLGFDMRSTLPAESLNHIFGNALHDMLPDWKLPHSPDLAMQGTLRHLRDGSWKSSLHAEALARKGSWKNIPFEKLLVRVDYRNGAADIDIPWAEALGGGLKGNVALRYDNEAQGHMNLDLSLFEASLVRHKSRSTR